MKNYKIDLKKQGYPVEGGNLECMLTDCVLDQDDGTWQRPAVIVVPGGAYQMVSKREGEPVANFFLANGFQCFVLTYLCAPDEVSYPEQLIELSAAVDFVKKNAKEYRINAEEVFVVGFSAGGHLVANLAVDYMNVSEKAGMKLDCKPMAVGLGYPVISSRKDIAHMGSFDNLLIEYTDEMREKLKVELDLDKAVTKDTVPSFIWTTAEDNCVPCQNSLCFALALANLHIPYELHVYPQGFHGLSTCNKEVDRCEVGYLKKNSQWIENCISFFRLFIKENF